MFDISIYASGVGKHCSFSKGQTQSCDAGQDECPPDVNCRGAWSECTTDCVDSVYTVSTPQSGLGTPCLEEGASKSCRPGQGLCPNNTDCVGNWTECNEDCQSVYTVATMYSGKGRRCSAIDDTTRLCSAGEGRCVTPPSEPLFWLRASFGLVAGILLGAVIVLARQERATTPAKGQRCLKCCARRNIAARLRLIMALGIASGAGFGFGFGPAACDPDTTCSGHGTCNDGASSVCLCAPLFRGDSCDECLFSGQYPNCTEAPTVASAEVINNNMAKISLVWGLNPDLPLTHADRHTFDPDAAECQHHLDELCRRLYVDAAVLGLQKIELEPERIEHNGVQWLRIVVYASSMPRYAAGFQALPLFNDFELLTNFVINRQSTDVQLPVQLASRVTPDGMGGLGVAPICLSAPAFHTSELWPRMFTEVTAVNGILWAIMIIIGSAFVAIFVFTASTRVAACVISTVSMILTCVLAFFHFAGYQLGIVEAVSVCVLLGSSVDYSLHIACAYVECCIEASDEDRRSGVHPEPAGSTWGQARRQMLAQQALRRIGGSVFHAAITTFLSVVCLVFCQVALFEQFGFIIAASVISSITFALLVLPALLVLFGPTVMSSGYTRGDVCAGVTMLGCAPLVAGGLWVFDMWCDGCVDGPDGTPLFRSLEAQ